LFLSIPFIVGYHVFVAFGLLDIVATVALVCSICAFTNLGLKFLNFGWIDLPEIRIPDGDGKNLTGSPLGVVPDAHVQRVGFPQ
jgi:hypothetical protein